MAKLKEKICCVICGKETEGEHVLLEGMAVCSEHYEETGKVKWQGIGYFRRDVIAEHRDEILRGNGIKALLLKSVNPSGMILLVQAEDWEKAQKVLEKHLASSFLCPVCNVEYSANELFCPSCGHKGR